MTKKNANVQPAVEENKDIQPVVEENKNVEENKELEENKTTELVEENKENKENKNNKNNKTTERVFTKKEFLKSTRFEKHRDILNVLLSDKKNYSIKDVEKIINDFLTKKVR